MPRRAARSSSAPAPTPAGAATACRGSGQWIGPDLSTIGVKYGRDELIRSILSPSAAIGYNFRSVVAGPGRRPRRSPACPSRRPPTGSSSRRPTGERVAVPTGSIEERRTSDVSLMPEGLAQTMTDQELVDLLAYLTTLRQPVSIVGQYHVLGPIAESGDAPRIDPASRRWTSRPSVDDGRGPQALLAAAECQRRGAGRPVRPGRRRLRRPARRVYALRAARLADRRRRPGSSSTRRPRSPAWLNGKPVTLSGSAGEKGEPRTADRRPARGVRLAPDPRAARRDGPAPRPRWSRRSWPTSRSGSPAK